MTMLEKLRADLKGLLDERDAHKAELDAVIAEAEARDDSTLSDEETAKFNEARDAIRGVDEKIDTLEGRIADLEDLSSRNEARAKLAADLHPEELPEGQRQFRVKQDEPTYRDGGKHSFFRDALSLRAGVATGDVAERLQRHANEVQVEQRDVGTGAFGALVVPQYLPQMFAENLKAGRVTANLASGLDLPAEGMTLEIPRGTTGTIVESQSDQNTALTEQDFDETTLSIPVRTIGGQQDVSRQAIERGYQIDQIIYADLAGSYAVELDKQVIAGPKTNGTHLGITATPDVLSVTTGTASAQSILAKIGQAAAAVNGARFMPANVIVMHPRRWGFLTTATDSNGRPLVVPTAGGPQNAFGSGEAAAYGFVGEIHGLPVYTDANIPTTVSSSTVTGATEDVILVAKREDWLLWEDGPAPRQFRFDETLGGQLTIKLVVADYSAFSAGRYPVGTAVISGSGMGAPVYP